MLACREEIQDTIAMRAMIIDGGARGQSMGAKLAAENVDIIMSPGNPGNESFAESTGIETTDIDRQLAFARSSNVDLVMVTADDPLALGAVDAFEDAGIAAFGPTKAQARVEWDRDYAKRLAMDLDIPIGDYGQFTDRECAFDYALEREWPLFVKENGLAQGKGAFRCENAEQLIDILDSLDQKNFFDSSEKLIIEDFIYGSEASHHAFCDGYTQISVPFLMRDHKQIGDGDKGLMTGGMGVVAPLPECNARRANMLGQRFVEPIVRELGFKGVLFPGLKGVGDSLKNLEWNARPGDPEMQVVMRMMKSKLLPIVMACVEGDLANIPPPEWHIGKAVVNLVLAAKGYPSNPEKGALIEGIADAEQIESVEVLHAGTAKKGSRLVVNGGRVLNIVTMADSLEQAIDQAYNAADCIRFDGKEPVMRHDIGRSTLDF